MPPGTGKTECFTRYASKYKKIILISPTRLLTQQNYTRMIEKFNTSSHNCLLVDSDNGGTTSVEEVSKAWNQKAVMISTTMESAKNVLTQVMLKNKQLKKDTIVVLFVQVMK